MSLAFVKWARASHLKCLASVPGLSVLSHFLTSNFHIASIDPSLGVLIVAATVSIGLIVIFRHGSSLGGIGILALYLQDQGLMKTGSTQLVFDIALFALAIFFVPWAVVELSLAGVVLLNVSIILNQRRDRYITF